MQAEVYASPEGGHPKAIWIALLVATLWIWWPIGLLLFVFLLCTGRLEAWKRAGLDLWHENTGSLRQPATWWSPRSSGNNAFDQYRSETLRRLEEEEREFREFLDRLRAAKDKSEFDQFMADRRNQTSPAPSQS